MKLCKNTGKTVTKVARELGVDSSGLYRWIRKYDKKESAARDNSNVAPCDKERFDLKTE
ncbi:hypothetical protein ASM33_05560 [Wolbachia endosymbiont of Folsomia candida]|nr:hypothetical protein ASM33_05560 [Wolbachia endosymbiont of Folsomia candida]